MSSNRFFGDDESTSAKAVGGYEFLPPAFAGAGLVHFLLQFNCYPSE
jgi:hypothetical protein